MALTDTFPTADSAGLSIADVRAINVGDIVRNSNGTPRLGLYPANALSPIVTSMSSMAVSVNSFVGAVSRTGGLTAEKIANVGATTVPVTAAPSSNSRIDVVYMIPRFSASGDGSNVPTFGVQAGTAASNPTKPTIPAGALELATITIPANATTTQSSGVFIAQTYPFTASAGGTVILRTNAEMSAFTPVAGTQGYRLDTQQMWIYDGGAWTLAQPGSVLIRPPSIVNAALAADGSVIVTGGTSVRIDDCFSSRYRHYRIVIRASLSGAGNVRCVLTSGGVDRATNYRTIASVTPGNTGQAVTSFAEGPNVTNWFLSSTGSDRKMFAIDLFNPGMASETFGLGQVGDWGGTGVASETWTGAHEVAVASDGFRLFIQDGTAFASADIKIYAYA